MNTSRRDVVWSLVGVALGLLFVWGGVTVSVQPNWELGRLYGILIAVAGAAGIAASLLTLVRPIPGGRSTMIAALGDRKSVV